MILKKILKWKKENPDEFDKVIADFVIIIAFIIIAVMAIYATQLT